MIECICEFIYSKCPWLAWKKKRVEEYNARVFGKVKENWHDDEIELKELIWERWKKGEQIEDFNFVVFIDIAEDLDWICDDDKSKNKMPRGASVRICEVMDAASLPCDSLPEAERMAYKKMLGSAIVSAFDGDLRKSSGLLRQALSYLRDRITERSRMWTLEAALVVGTALFLLGWWVFDRTSPATFGLLGAWISIVRKAGNRLTDSNAGKWLHWLEVLMRLSAGMVLGILGVKLFSCQLAPCLMQELCLSASGCCVVAFASGLLDGLVPSMISRYVVKPLNLQGEEDETLRDNN